MLQARALVSHPVALIQSTRLVQQLTRGSGINCLDFLLCYKAPPFGVG